MRVALLAFGFAFAASSALAQDLSADAFTDGPNGAKVHVASGFVCPATIGHFERDAVGQSDVETGADFCSYAALDGVYGTIRLTPLSGPYDPKASLVQDFIEQEGTGGKRISENVVKVAPLAVFTRTYETAKLEDLPTMCFLPVPRCKTGPWKPLSNMRARGRMCRRRIS